MTSRTTHAVLTFERPFLLKALGTMQPAGEYDVAHDEDLIEGLSRGAYRRVASFINLPARGSAARTRQFVPIASDELEALLEIARSEGS